MARMKIKKALIESRQDAACSAAVALALGLLTGWPWQSWLSLAVALVGGSICYNLWLVSNPHAHARRTAKRAARRKRRAAPRRS
ncbi:hypothetical protein [Streptacidiphilus anmyonensis]|uniref:hypothetical protein n=1 Tax=Streptacidiphilus anmyonensis TaxID=405782 RepID=UPI00128E0DDB|nr:hypothetical protein [Streptacidiphilus anmyonensis]